MVYDYSSIYFISIYISFFGHVCDKLWTLWVSRNFGILMREIKLVREILVIHHLLGRSTDFKIPTGKRNWKLLCVLSLITCRHAAVVSFLIQLDTCCFCCVNQHCVFPYQCSVYWRRSFGPTGKFKSWQSADMRSWIWQYHCDWNC